MTRLRLHRVLRSFSAVIFVLATASRAGAQDPTGAIEGAVTDRTGSAIPAATILAEHRDTGFRREAVPSTDGLYRLQLLPIGSYRVTVKATGFGRVDFDVRSALTDLYSANSRALMFGTDLPSTRAPRPYEDGDYTLVLETLGEEKATNVFYENALEFYRPKKILA